MNTELTAAGNKGIQFTCKQSKILFASLLYIWESKLARTTELGQGHRQRKNTNSQEQLILDHSNKSSYECSLMVSLLKFLYQIKNKTDSWLSTSHTFSSVNTSKAHLLKGRGRGEDGNGAPGPIVQRELQDYPCTTGQGRVEPGTGVCAGRGECYGGTGVSGVNRCTWGGGRS